jgi:catechol 2,3-dioxygenase-like lactoylglutathione lyase family enzyme
MKRFHVHMSVKDLDESIRFYTNLFGQPPTVRETDYAKWMVEDPRINFAVSTRSRDVGVDHLGFQVESGEELQEVQRRLTTAQLPVKEQVGAACCYSRSDKYWTIDPQGIAWETFHTLDRIPVFGEGEPREDMSSGCCVPEIPVPFPPVR